MAGYLGKKERRLPPRGISGGEKGSERGKISEEKVFKALEWLKYKETILDFRKTSEDTPGKDFIIQVKKGSRKIINLPLEVKSSGRGRDRHARKKHQTPVIVVRDRDETFKIAHLIKMILELS